MASPKLSRVINNIVGFVPRCPNWGPQLGLFTVLLQGLWCELHKSSVMGECLFHLSLFLLSSITPCLHLSQHHDRAPYPNSLQNSNSFSLPFLFLTSCFTLPGLQSPSPLTSPASLLGYAICTFLLEPPLVSHPLSRCFNYTLILVNLEAECRSFTDYHRNLIIASTFTFFSCLVNLCG